MADRMIPRAEDIFSGRVAGGKEPRSQLFKNKKAPAPPSGAPLPKIGSYQPKSLAAVTPGAPVEERTELRPADKAAIEQHKAKQYVIGDKDTPLKIEIIELDDQPVAPPRRKRRASDIEIHEDSENIVSDNPLYGRQVSNMSSDDRNLNIPNTDKRGSVDISNVSIAGSSIDPDYDEQSGVIDFGIGIDDEPIMYSNRNGPTQRQVEVEVHQNGDKDYPYIPPPDYDAEERTFNFEDEDGKAVFKEYVGEDFGKYLEDDDDLRPNGHLRMPGAHRHMKGKYPSKPRVQGKKYKKKVKRPESDKRNTIRDFTFTDTKIGWGDRTVKSTSAKGRYIKREKERQRIDTVEHLTRSQSQAGTYEDFLMAKHGGLDSPNSSDSGVDTGEELINRRHSVVQGEVNRGYHTDGRHDRPASEIHAFYHSQPKQMRESNARDGHKAGLWKRLTWRFKKSINISSNEHR